MAGLRFWHMKIRALLIVAAAGYFAWPYAALLKLRQDLRHHDVEALQRDVDWQSVRGAIKKDFGGGFAALKPPVSKISTAPEDDLPPFGASFASAATDNAIDSAVTPQRLADAFSSINPPGGEAAQPNVEAARFSGMTSFLVKLRPAQLAPSDQAVRLELRLVRRGWHIGWQVTRVTMPESLLHDSETHAS